MAGNLKNAGPCRCHRHDGRRRSDRAYVPAQRHRLRIGKGVAFLDDHEDIR